MKLTIEQAATQGIDWQRHRTLLRDYREQLVNIAQQNTYNDDEASINCCADEEIVSRVLALKNQLVSTDLKYIFVVGIGGSNLGTKAVYDALSGFFDGVRTDFPRMIFIDTNNAAFAQYIQQMAQHVTSLDEILITVITKSGGTSETLANAEFVIDAFAQHNEDIHNRLVFITDEGSRLWQAATEKSCAVLPIPAKVGGRYSVFSAVGLFPLACAGYDIQALLRGAAEMREQCLLEENNPAIDSAALLFEANNQGFFINDNFIFHGELESVGKWYRQLMGESIGKEEDREGNAVTAGITPTVSIGSTDLHSVGQLYLGGPKNKLTTFISAVQQAPIRVPENRLFPDLVPNITGISFKEIMNAIREGTQKAYKKQGAPFMNIELSAINESELGAFMQFKMIEMMYLGRLMQVNPFDQPHVELYKIETKRILEQQ